MRWRNTVKILNVRKNIYVTAIILTFVKGLIDDWLDYPKKNSKDF